MRDQASSESFTTQMRSLGETLKAARLRQREWARAAKAAEAQLQSLQAELQALLEVRVVLCCACLALCQGLA